MFPGGTGWASAHGGTEHPKHMADVLRLIETNRNGDLPNK